MIKYLLFAYCLLNSFQSAFSQSIFKVNKNNKVYFGVDNQVNIISKYNPDQLIVLANQDTLTYINQSFYYKTLNCELKHVVVKIGVKRKMKKIKWLDSASYNIEYVPYPPIARCSVAPNDTIVHAHLNFGLSIFLDCGESRIPCSQLCPYAKICAFDLKILRNDSLLYQEAHFDKNGLYYIEDYFVDENNDTSRILAENTRSISWNALHFLIQNSKKGDVILFENVKAVLCKKDEVDVNGVRLIIE